MAISIYMIEDDPAVRRHVEDIIGASASCRIAGVACTGAEALARRDFDDVDVFIVDLGLPDMDGIDLIERLIARNGEARVLVLSTFSGSRQVMRSLQAGAHGYLTKDAVGERLVEQIVALNNGLAPLSPAISKIVLEKLRHMDPVAHQDAGREQILAELDISKREWDVLEMLIEGLSIMDISGRLYISHHTVNQHLRAIYRKLNVQSRSMAVAAARKHGLVDA
ncbi:MAG: response regulator transcription factor [Candidatus Dactylopiibacterium sp.]|nr:response regulator transcription factor [Candidatus Dactylopiibacterium sp.]